MRKLLTLLTVLVLSLTVFSVDWLKTDVNGERGGSLYVSTTTGPKTLNPYWYSDQNSDDFISLFAGMMLSQDENGFFTHPYLAKDYNEKITEEGKMEITFELREGIKWTDGEDFNADDVVFSFTKLAFDSSMSYNGNNSYLDSEDNLPEVVKVDDYTVKFIYETPLRTVTESIGSTYILPEHVFSGIVGDPEKFAQMWTVEQIDKIVGIGPFIIDDYREGVRVILKRNPNFFAVDNNGTQLPYLDQIVYQIVQNNETEVLKFQAGELDLLSLSASNYVSMKEKESESNYSTVIGGLVPGPSIIGFNWNSPIKEQRVWFRSDNFRRAVSYALNRQAIVDNNLNGLGAAVYTEQVPGSIYYDEEYINSLGYRYSLASARRELQQGGFTWDNKGKLYGPEGNHVKFDLTTNVSTTVWVEIGNILSDALGKLGMTVNVRPLQFNTLVTELSSGEYQSMIIRFSGDSPDPHNGWNMWQLDEAWHFWNFSPETLAEKGNPDLLDPEDYYVPDFERRIDEIYQLEKVTLDEDKVIELFTEMNNLIAKHQPLIYTFAQNILIAKSDDLHLMIEEPKPYVGTLWRIWGVWKEQ